ncbi:MAG: ribose-phosphate pyrophosphokinase [Oligoflexales bacterium]|nr:ribose-phosphate pyrophosphokinase [Oligoflexales bacterium]
MPSVKLKIFSGTSHPQLASSIAKSLRIKLSPMEISRFACGEIYAKPLETVRRSEVFIVQTCTNNVNEDLMELFVMLDAFKRSSAEKIHVIIPHYGYGRQDRVASAREPITAKLIANLIAKAGADNLITISLHSDQEQGFFDFPVDHVGTHHLFADYFKKKNLKNLVVVATDAGGVKDVRRFANLLGCPIALIHKVRPKHNVAEASHVVGDVEGKVCLIFDDMIDTAGSVCAAKKALLGAGAEKDMYLAATHAVFSDPAVERLKEANFKEVVVTDTIPLPSEKQFKGLKVLSTASLLAHIVKNVFEGRSVSGVQR